MLVSQSRLARRAAAAVVALLALATLAVAALPASGSFGMFDSDSSRMKPGVRAFTAQSANPAAEFAVGTPAFNKALEVANRYWNNAVACGGNFVVRWVPLEPLTNARATWHNPFDAWNNPGQNFDCRVDFNSSTRYDFAMFCSVLTHELGHLLGHPHDEAEGLLMSAIYSDPLPECVNADPAAAAAAAEEAARRAAQQAAPPAPAAPVASRPASTRKVKSTTKRPAKRTTSKKRARSKRCFFRWRSGRRVRMCVQAKRRTTRLSRRVGAS